MIYSAAVCPHLASPHARRKIEVTKPAAILPKGDRRGDIAAIVGYSYQLTGRDSKYTSASQSNCSSSATGRNWWTN